MYWIFFLQLFEENLIIKNLVLSFLGLGILKKNN
jgi:hypothetical protein